MPDQERYPGILESPPPASEGVPTACQYCVVGCGYEAHIWAPGTGAADPPQLEQGNWVSPAMTGEVRVDGERKVAAVLPDPKCSMNKGNHSPRGGTQGRDLVYSSDDVAEERDSTRERITSAYLRTKNGFEAIPTGRALAILSALVKKATGWHVDGGEVKFATPRRLGVKLYEYQYLENTFAATRLLFQMIGTPNVAFHDRPSVASNTIGFEDSGIDPHGYAYEDIWMSDVLFLAGNNPYEAHSVFFMQYMTGKRIIVLDPRRTITADYAEKTGGLHLRPKVLGADSLVLNALARHIRDRQRANPADWPERVPRELVMSDDEWERLQADGASANPGQGPDRRRRARYLLSLNKYFEFLDTPGDDGRPLYSLQRAADVSGIPIERLEECARLLAGPDDQMEPPKRRRVSLIFEKGLIWGYNYQNTAAMANLGLLLGSVFPLTPTGQKPGPTVLGVTGRAGGHQKGWAEVRYRLPGDDVTKSPARGYPFQNASDEFVADDGSGARFRTHHYLDAHLVGTSVAPVHPRARVNASVPDINLFWVVGCNPVGQMGNSRAKWDEIARRKGDEIPAGSDEAEDVLLRKIDEGKLVVVQQDIYPNPTTQYTDLILPAAGWGEENFARYTGERRLRLYSKFQDAPAHRLRDGQLERDANGKVVSRCLPDWRIFRHVALEMLPDAATINELRREDLLAWTDTAAVFRDMARSSNRAGLLGALEPAGAGAPQGHELLRRRKTQGFLLPVRPDLAQPGRVIEFPRTPVDKRKFADGTPFGPYAFVRADWREIERDFARNLPRRDQNEFVICNGRVNELWNSMFTHIRNETIRQRYPDDMPGTLLELHPEDAQRLGLTNGDVVEVTCHDIHMGGSSSSFTGVASVQDAGDEAPVSQGMVFAVFSYPAMTARLDAFPYRDFTARAYINNVTTGYVDPVNPIAAVKYARGRLRRTGERYSSQRALAEGQPAYLGPSFRRRNRAFPSVMVEHEGKRLEWKVRELIVQKGLPRVRVHEDFVPESVLKLFLAPDLFVEAFRRDNTLRQRVRAALPLMVLPFSDPNREPDRWTQQEMDLVTKWFDQLDHE